MYAMQIFDDASDGLLGGAIAAADHYASYRRRRSEETHLQKWISYADSLERERDYLQATLAETKLELDRATWRLKARG